MPACRRVTRARCVHTSSVGLKAATAIVATSLLVMFCACTNRAPHAGGVLSPAPTGCGIIMGGPFRYAASPNASPVRLLAGHLPRWFPDGFGVEQLSQLGTNGAVRWTDASCRGITVSFGANPYSAAPPGHWYGRPGDMYGAWTVISPQRGDFIYRAAASNGTVALESHAVPRATMDRVARSVPLRLSASPP